MQIIIGHYTILYSAEFINTSLIYFSFNNLEIKLMGKHFQGLDLTNSSNFIKAHNYPSR